MLALVAFTLVGVVGIYYAIRGFPTTPMTVARANNLCQAALPPGTSREDVQVWLASQGTTANGHAHRPYYDVLYRPVIADSEPWWMDRIGNETVAECAGLRVDDVFRLLRIKYPDADRFFLGRTEIKVYLFFDNNDRLIKYWVKEFHLMP
jgi:hypothetical protein